MVAPSAHRPEQTHFAAQVKHRAPRIRWLALVLPLVASFVGCRKPTPVTVDRGSVATTAVVRETYTTNLHASQPANFLSCNGSQAGYDVTRDGKVTWTPMAPETKELCVYVSPKGSSSTRFTWTVTASWPVGRSPADARAAVEGLRRELAAVSTASAPWKCSADVVQAARGTPIPVVLHDDLVGPVGPRHALGGWRPVPFLADLETDPGKAWALDAAAWVFVVEPSSYVEPVLGLNHHFESGSFVGALVLVDRKAKTARCRARLAFESSELVYTSGDEGVRRDFLERGTHALFTALASLGAPPLEADLPNMPPEILARSK